MLNGSFRFLSPFPLLIFFNPLLTFVCRPRRSIFRLPVIDPLSLPAKIWGSIVLAIDLVYTAFMVPLSLAFNQSLGVNAYTIFDIIGSVVYICGILFDFHIGFIVKWDAASVVITDGWEVAKQYVRHGTFVIDVIAALPIILQILFVIFRSFSYNQEAIRLLLILKLLRLLRVVHILKVCDSSFWGFGY